MSNRKPPRRAWLKVAAASAGTGAAAAAKAQGRRPIRLRFQSMWPPQDILHEYANDFARKVNDMTAGRLQLELVPAGSLAPTQELLEAVADGRVDAAHGVVDAWYRRHPALGLWGSGPAFGMDPNMVLSWHYYGGGRQLLEAVYRELGLLVQSFLYGPMPTQPLGWFERPLNRSEDLRGMRMRSSGLAEELFRSMGAAMHSLEAREIVPALEQGRLDAAEYNNASSDRALGLPAVAAACMLRSFHQPSAQFEVLFNRRRFDSLGPDLKAIIEFAVQAASAEMSWKAIDRYSRDYLEMRERKAVRFVPTPEPILRAQLAAWDKVVAGAGADPLFRRVQESMKAYARRCGGWQNDTTVDHRIAYQHYFGKSAPRN